MKRWQDARSRKEREVLVENALRRAGSVTAAARLLHISRRHLTRFLSETRCLTETPETPGTFGRSETRPSKPPLTTLLSMRTVADDTRNEPQRTVDISLPVRLLQWVDEQALKRKLAGLTRRPTRSHVIVDALREYKRNVEAAQAAMRAMGIDDDGREEKERTRDRGDDWTTDGHDDGP